jgi:hypothetical protein
MYMPKSRKGQRRVVHNQRHYKVGAMLRDPWFIQRADWLRQRLKDTGCPIPPKPLKTYKQYLAWNDRFWDRYTAMKNSAVFLEEKNRIAGSKRKISTTEYDALEKYKDAFLPPVYGEVFREILQHFHFNPDDTELRDFLIFYFFFGATEYHTEPLKIALTRNERTREIELHLRIYGHTKKEDIMRHWKSISDEQRHLKDFIGKNKAWVTFNRDIEIYLLYKKMKATRGDEQLKTFGIDQRTYAELHFKYRGITINNIRSIVSRTRKRLGEI